MVSRIGDDTRAETPYGQLLEISQPIKSLDYVETESFGIWCRNG